MTLRLRNLGSGSSGNATLIEAHSGTTCSRLLIDCGLRVSEVKKRLQACDLELSDIDAVFVTHEHSDHWGHAASLCRRLGIPLWSSEGTMHAVLGEGADLDELDWNQATDGVPIDLGDLQLLPFTVPHDAREPLQLCCTDGDRRLGVVTDLGHASAHVVRALQGLHGIMLETNHDLDRLRLSAYPPFLKQRISSNLGHLSNPQSAQLLRDVMHPGLRLVLAAHLSERNNAPELARAALAPVLGCNQAEVPVADPEQGSDWWSV
ncbi:MAG: MBL fold metallo-hydrolase [Alphaproteobacteria bacterium]|nr:MBL fold metallo-hydrolase [Alphaproteobacteria bacterium]